VGLGDGCAGTIWCILVCVVFLFLLVVDVIFLAGNFFVPVWKAEEISRLSVDLAGGKDQQHACCYPSGPPPDEA